MATAGVITRKDIISDDALQFGDLYVAEVQKAIKANDQLVSSAKDLAVVVNSYRKVENQQQFLDLKNQEILVSQKALIAIKEQTTADIAAEKIKQAKIATEKAELALKNSVIAASQKNTKATAEEIVNKRLETSNALLSAKANSSLTDAYTKLSAQQAIAANSVKNIIANGKLADETQAQYNKRLETAQKDFDVLNNKVRSADAAVGIFNRNVGNYPQQAVQGLKSLISAFGVTSGIYLFAAAIKHGFEVTREFEKANADLAAYMGKTRAEISGLTDEQLRLAVVTKYSATEIAGVQKELAKSGFNDSQIKQATISVLNFASAVGTDLETSVQVTDTVLKTFGLRTSETTRVNDVMAKSFTSSRLRLEDFKESIKYVAPIAASLNIPFEKVVSLLSVLADNGVKGSMAGTSLRRILTELTKTGGDFNTAFDKLTKSGITVKDAFDEVGRTAQTTLLILSKHRDKLDDLQKAYENAGGTADKMAKEQLNTLDGKIHILTSSWDTFLISLSKGDGALSKISKWFIDLTNETINFYTELNNASGSFNTIFYKKTDEGYISSLKDMQTEAKKTGVEIEKLAKVKQDQALKNRDAAIWEINALKQYQEEQRKIVQTKDPSLGVGDQVIRNQNALKNYDQTDEKIKELAKTYGYWNGVVKATSELLTKNTDVVAKNADGADQQSKYVREATSANKDYLVSLYEVIKTWTENAITKNKEISDDEKRTIAERVDANTEMYSLRTKQANDDYQEQLRVNNFKLTDDLRVAKATMDNELAANKERIAKDKFQTDYSYQIKKDYYAKIHALADNAGNNDIIAFMKLEEKKREIDNEDLKNKQAIIDSEVAIVQKGIDEKKQLYDTEKNVLIQQENSRYKSEIDLAKDNYSQLEKAKTQHEERLLKIENDASKKSLQATIDNLQTELDANAKEDESCQISADKRLKIEQELQSARAQLGKLEIDNNADKLKKEIDKQKDYAQKMKDIEHNLAQALKGFVDALFAARIQTIDNQITATDNYYANEIEKAGNDQNKKNSLAAEQKKKDDELAKKKREEQHKEAVYNKVLALANIGLKTAQAIMAAQLVIQEMNSISFGVAGTAYAAWAIPAIYATGALEAGAVVATPIPQYKHGRKGGPEEIAKVGDGGRSEIITHDDGSNPIVTPNTPTLVKLLEGDIVHRSIDDYQRYLRASLLANIGIENDKMSAYQSSIIFDIHNDKLIDEMREVKKVIKNQKQNIIINTPKIDINHAIWAMGNKNWRS